MVPQRAPPTALSTGSVHNAVPASGLSAPAYAGRVRRTALALTALLLTAALAACGGGDGDASGAADEPTPTTAAPSATSAAPTSAAPTSEAPTEEPAGQVVEITFSGDDVMPNGDRVQVTAGEPVTFEVTADAPGEIHVHSNPEQELEYGEGQTSLELVFDQPGVVEVESHDLDKVIVQLEVRP